MLSGVNINIIGPDDLSASPFVSFLEEHTQAQCHIFNTRHILENGLPRQSVPSITLVDGQNNQQHQALDIYYLTRNRSELSDLFAFFNITSGSEIEQIVGDLDIHGLFYADIVPEHVSRGIDAILNGELWLPRKVLSEQLLKTKPGYANKSDYNQNHDVLTHREIEILNLIATGAKNSDIARSLSLSVHTIKTHIYHIYKKLDVSNRMQAVNWASRNL